MLIVNNIFYILQNIFKKRLDKLHSAIYNVFKLCISQIKRGGEYMQYIGICKERGNVVEEKFCFGYALNRILSNKEEKQEFIEWYYSGNWIKIEKEGEIYE